MDRNEVCRIVNCPNSLGDQVVNSLIMAGNAFFGTLVGLGAIGVWEKPALAVLGAGISAGFTFFSTLAMQRGLKRFEEKPEA